jgi:hypothetical protein
MNMPMSLPEWMPLSWLPWWGVLLVLLPAMLFLLAFLAMPFSVLGLKTRLEAIEERLDEIQGEVRALSLRLPERGEAPVPIPPMPIPPARSQPAQQRQPAPRPAPEQYEGEDEAPPRQKMRPPIPPEAQRPRRSEPRLDWPR